MTDLTKFVKQYKATKPESTKPEVISVVQKGTVLTPEDLYKGFVDNSYKTTCCHGNGGCDSCYSNCDM
ncbi:MAG: hypothetical protein ACQESC_04755 [Nanobdellota archaeon]